VSSAPKSTTAKKARVKKEVVSSTLASPSKVTKKRSLKKTTMASDAEYFESLVENDRMLKGEDEESMDYKLVDEEQKEQTGYIDVGDVFYNTKDEDEDGFY
jgi:hypothetical protein